MLVIDIQWFLVIGESLNVLYNILYDYMLYNTFYDTCMVYCTDMKNSRPTATDASHFWK